MLWDVTITLAVAALGPSLGADVSEPIAGPDPDPQTAARPAADADPVSLVVQGVGVDPTQLVEELRLRLPGRDVTEIGASRPAGAYAYAVVSRDATGLRMTLILPQGDAYDRSLDTEPDQDVRISASALANLVFAVESGDATPTRTDVELPPVAADPEPEPEPQEPEPVPQEPEPVPEPPDPVEPSPTPAVEPRHVLGVGLRPGVALGLAPSTDAPAFSGGGLALDASLRARSGATGWLAVRGLGLSRDDHSLVRVRIAAGGGYTWRRGLVDVGLLGAAFVEPWSMRDGSGRVVVQRPDGDRAGAPLLGALLALKPSIRVGPGPARRGRPEVRIGAQLDLAGGFVVDDGVRTVELGLQTPTGREPWARLGGLELGLGLDISIWFGLGASSQRR